MIDFGRDDVRLESDQAKYANFPVQDDVSSSTANDTSATSGANVENTNVSGLDPKRSDSQQDHGKVIGATTEPFSFGLKQMKDENPDSGDIPSIYLDYTLSVAAHWDPVTVKLPNRFQEEAVTLLSEDTWKWVNLERWDPQQARHAPANGMWIDLADGDGNIRIVALGRLEPNGNQITVDEVKLVRRYTPAQGMIYIRYRTGAAFRVKYRMQINYHADLKNGRMAFDYEVQRSYQVDDVMVGFHLGLHGSEFWVDLLLQIESAMAERVRHLPLNS